MLLMITEGKLKATTNTGAKRLYVPEGTQNQYGWRQRARFSISIFAGVYNNL